MQSLNGYRQAIAGVVALAVLLAAGTAGAATFSWFGYGVSGGNASNDWTDVNNWRVEGAVPAAAPGAADDVVATFTVAQPSGVDAIVVPNGAQGRDVRFNGYAVLADNGPVQFASGGTATFETLHLLQYTNRKVDFGTGGTVILTGGAAANPTLKTVQGNTLAWIGAPSFELTSATVYVDHGATTYPSAGTYAFTNPSAAIDVKLLNAASQLTGGGFTFHPGQTITGAPFLAFTGNLVNAGAPGTRLDNLSGVGLVNADGNVLVAPATAKYLHVSRLGGLAGGVVCTLNGDVTVADKPPAGIGLPEYSLLVRREDRGIAANSWNYGARLIVGSGNTLSVAATSAPAVVGRPDYAVEGNWNPCGLVLNGGTAVFASDLLLGPQGVLVGDAAGQVRIAGDFDLRSRRGNMYDMKTSTIWMNGAGTPVSPQFFEVHCFDNGSAGSHTDRFGLGSLIIGTDALHPTYVQLVDHWDYGPDGADADTQVDDPDGLIDAQYLSGSTLVVNAGSVLDLNGLHLYVDSALIDPGTGYIYTPQGGRIFDSTRFVFYIPEPMLPGLALAALAALGRRTRR